MDKKVFLKNVDEACRDFRSLLGDLDEPHLLQQGTWGNWSIKDMIAHLTWYEREMLGVLENRALVGSDLWNCSLEQRNAAIQAANQDRTLGDILDEAGRVHASLLVLLDALKDEELLDPACFREMPPDWVPWQVIASNTFEHYTDHARDIRKAFSLP